MFADKLSPIQTHLS